MTRDNEELLPVGSVVYLKGGILKLVIIARGQLVTVKERAETPTYFDYLGCIYPQGFDKNDTYYFNQENIERTVFSGYKDEEEKRYQEVLKEWMTDNPDKYVIGKVEFNEKGD